MSTYVVLRFKVMSTLKCNIHVSASFLMYQELCLTTMKELSPLDMTIRFRTSVMFTVYYYTSLI